MPSYMQYRETERESATRKLMAVLLPMLHHVTEESKVQLEECLDDYVKAWVDERHEQNTRRGDW